MKPPAGRVLIADDVATNVELLRRALAKDGYEISTVADGASVLDAVGRNPPDVLLLDVMMPRMDGFEVCRRLKGDAATRLIPIVLVTALEQREHRIRGAQVGADDFLTKPVDVLELRARVHALVRLKRHTDELDSAAAIIMSFGEIIEARDAYTQGHCQRLSIYASALGAALGLPGEDVRALGRGGFLHDVGKVAISDLLLMKPGAFTTDEHDRVKPHTVIGEALCGNLRSLQAVRPIVRWHHERLDGSGYPDHLEGDSIPLLAQITGIVDVYDALTTPRPYRSPVRPEEAFETLRREVRAGWRRHELVEAFVDLVATGRFDRFESPDVRASIDATTPGSAATA